MQCEQFEQILVQQDEGALTNTALSHMESCEACRTLSADFGAIHEMALELGAEGIAPPERVWVSLRAQLEAEGIIRGDEAGEVAMEAAKPKRGWFAGILDVVPRPVLAEAWRGSPADARRDRHPGGTPFQGWRAGKRSRALAGRRAGTLPVGNA